MYRIFRPANPRIHFISIQLFILTCWLNSYKNQLTESAQAYISTANAATTATQLLLLLLLPLLLFLIPLLISECLPTAYDFPYKYTRIMHLEF
jgi:hypothetical protein